MTTLRFHLMLLPFYLFAAATVVSTIIHDLTGLPL